ncbi:tetrahydrodipicolinate N-succinyltransferase N-terminal domain-containing protein [Arcobacter porcinus]|uniref:Tetrahydrodipicolinate N-succinyltransferase domain-containing protein (N-terminal, middle domains) n=1 Tax=Arcobacter porcinus TaxID=1935204 RepID=A0A5C2HBV2_9BACT|nr:tetrahydrodipicolinate N-succinyltransferase N-terminal domain-containing protein [Arcobacter porcinus]OCL88862.1 2,3,4,5-tetrahydropyridine-2,6-dicarboxylate N-succinyltransferase [Aliarcobacter thereius]QEP40406.1 tetrahydrodipicolinate N-succinyltransferase domain-containing protein (N-terminal, middle domains) [Arcobacter porcinus]
MINTKEDFDNLVDSIKKEKWYRKPLAFGIARITRGVLNPNLTLDATFSHINWDENEKSAAIFLAALKQNGQNVDCFQSEGIYAITDGFLGYCIEAYKPFYEEKEKHKNLQVVSTLASLPINSGLEAEDFRVVFIFEDDKPKSVESIYLKLYAKHSKSIQNLNLENIDELLTNCAWIDGTPMELELLRENEIMLKIANKFPQIEYIGKYAKVLRHIIPNEDKSICEKELLK